MFEMVTCDCCGELFELPVGEMPFIVIDGAVGIGCQACIDEEMDNE